MSLTRFRPRRRRLPSVWIDLVADLVIIAVATGMVRVAITLLHL